MPQKFLRVLYDADPDGNNGGGNSDEGNEPPDNSGGDDKGETRKPAPKPKNGKSPEEQIEAMQRTIRELRDEVKQTQKAKGNAEKTADQRIAALEESNRKASRREEARKLIKRLSGDLDTGFAVDQEEVYDIVAPALSSYDDDEEGLESYVARVLNRTKQPKVKKPDVPAGTPPGGNANPSGVPEKANPKDYTGRELRLIREKDPARWDRMENDSPANAFPKPTA